MLRDKSLIPLSRQHQHALALCVRIDRAQPIADRDVGAWQAEINQQFQQEIRIHFAAEEDVLFPVARNFPDLISLVDELVAEHDWLRREFTQAEAGKMSAEDLPRFAGKLSQHIRKEERQLSNGCNGYCRRKKWRLWEPLSKMRFGKLLSPAYCRARPLICEREKIRESRKCTKPRAIQPCDLW